MAAEGAAFERHYSVEELTELWGMSNDFVRRLFLQEPGVVVFWRQQPGKRVYRTIRIPASVALRVHRRMSRIEDDAGSGSLGSSITSVRRPGRAHRVDGRFHSQRT